MSWRSSGRWANWFPIILRLAIDAVGASRGLLMTVENEQLVERGSRGDRFKLRKAVRDRVLDQKLSVLVRDTRLDDALRNSQSIISANVHTLMAVPLQVREEVGAPFTWIHPACNASSRATISRC